MRRLIGIALTASVLIGTGWTLEGNGVSVLQASALEKGATPCLERSWIPRAGMPTAEKHWRLVRLVDCAVSRWWPGAGHTRAALDAAWHESGYDTFAYNSTGCSGYGCLGAWQQHARYWEGRRDFYLRPGWFRHYPIAWTNARAQTIVAVRMMAANGGVCPDWC
jgi:hypothetical protein